METAREIDAAINAQRTDEAKEIRHLQVIQPVFKKEKNDQVATGTSEHDIDPFIIPGDQAGGYVKQGKQQQTKWRNGFVQNRWSTSPSS